MNSKSRIPELSAVSFDEALRWFAEMQRRGLLFHPDDDPADIMVIRSGERMFSAREVQEARLLLDKFFVVLGDGFAAFKFHPASGQFRIIASVEKDPAACCVRTSTIRIPT